jgi:putative lipoprotein (rSAM/lipoprotein system)
MKTNVKKWMNVLLGAILGMFGYGCKDSGPVAMYGVPSGDLTFDSQVTNESSKPLEGIQVVRRGGWKDGTGTMRWEDRADTMHTDANGKVHREYQRDFPLIYHKVIVSDVTGEYQPDSVIKEVKYSGGRDAWYQGKATLETNFVLRKKDK